MRTILHHSVRIGLCLLLSLLLIGCQDDMHVLLDGQRSIAHAGGMAAGRTYTNSLEALQSSRSKGFRIIEIDLNWTQDEELVLIHDWGQTWRTLFNETGIPTLEEFVSANMIDGLKKRVSMPFTPIFFLSNRIDEGLFVPNCLSRIAPRSRIALDCSDRACHPHWNVIRAGIT